MLYNYQRIKIAKDLDYFIIELEILPCLYFDSKELLIDLFRGKVVDSLSV